MVFASDMEMMKERFAKLLLGEDMSGGGKGVSSALALSNAITNLAGYCISYSFNLRISVWFDDYTVYFQIQILFDYVLC